MLTDYVNMEKMKNAIETLAINHWNRLIRLKDRKSRNVIT